MLQIESSRPVSTTSKLNLPENWLSRRLELRSSWAWKRRAVVTSRHTSHLTILASCRVSALNAASDSSLPLKCGSVGVYPTGNPPGTTSAAPRCVGDSKMSAIDSSSNIRRPPAGSASTMIQTTRHWQTDAPSLTGCCMLHAACCGAKQVDLPTS